MRAWTLAALAALAATTAHSQTLAPDIPAKFHPVTSTFDFDRRVVDIRMRDGITLHTIILSRKGAKDAPILFERTPYNAESGTSKTDSAHAAMLVGASGAEFLDAGYILVVQDVRGKYGSKGDYVNERPLIGPLNHTRVDHATDAYDSIAWLVKNVPQSNGRVGMIGTSYDGMMVAMALTAPHPALKAAVPMNPVINTWMGDDDFHGGAARIIGYDYYFSQDSVKGDGGDLWRDSYDDYDTFLRAGSASAFVKSRGLEQLPFVRALHDHPAYDGYWQAQALETILPKRTPSVPTLWVASQWDQEDIYGAVAAYEALAPVDPDHLNHLAFGPWKHGGWAGDGSSLGAVKFDADTAKAFRRDTLIPFLDAHLKTGGAPVDLPPVLAFQTGTNRWQRLPGWPLACGGTTCPHPMQRFAFGAAGTLTVAALPVPEGYDEYVADPAKPIPYRLRPIRPTYGSNSTWGQWLVDDQRPFGDRTDVLTFTSPVLAVPLAIAGAPVVDLTASTTGSDGDFVVKLIDVYPGEYAPDPKLGGYQLPIAMDILRGRYRESFSEAKPIVAGATLPYKITLPNANHVFLPGHRIMVQVQSSWFPLYDRNPQTFVPNVFDARPDDYQKATIRVFHGGATGSMLELPVVP